MTRPAGLAVVETTAGPVRGRRHGAHIEFLGVPFASSTAGGGRWRPPRPPGSWTGVRDATTPGPACPQVEPLDGPLETLLTAPLPHSDDCLCLNVYTPAIDDLRRPTIVWLHGGGFTYGSGAAPPMDAFACDGAVGVGVNYRLGPLGFLYLAELFPGVADRGNVGLLDQVAALLWVRDNIERFGGDAHNVTVLGQSAGGMSVAALMAMPAAHGLFRRAIVQSGSADAYLLPEEATSVTRRFCELVGVRPGDETSLRVVPTGEITRAGRALEIEAGSLLPQRVMMPLPFQPVVDATSLPKPPIDAIGAGSAPGVDLLVGSCADELRYFFFRAPEAMRLAMLRAGIDRYFHSATEQANALDRYREVDGDDEAAALCALHSDAWFGAPTERLADAQCRHTANVYRYRFSWPTPVLGGALGACHGVDLPFLFGCVDEAAALVGRDPPRSLTVELRSAFIRFAATGLPGDIGGVPWPRYDAGRRPVLDVGLTTGVLNDPAASTRGIWDDAFGHR